MSQAGAGGRAATGGIDRRTAVAGLAALLAAPALRPAAAAEAEAVPAILARSGLGELCGFALADPASGRLIEAHRADVAQPPASVVKILTALYALDALGPDFRFRTVVAADAAVEGGVLRGDIVLRGGGDPRLDTDAMGDLVRELRAGGLARIDGGLRIDASALPFVRRIDGSQPLDAAYNPSISGVNLNFNRVLLAWTKGSDGPRWTFGAPGLRHTADVATIRAELAKVRGPRHRLEGGHEIWTLPARSLSGEGRRWLPVRDPVGYAGEVFARLAEAGGLELGAAGPGPPLAAGRTLVEHAGPELHDVLVGMLRHSTNLTAEAVGIRAGIARGGAPRSLAQSAAAMTAWARARYGLGRADLVNHSGLTDRSRLAPAEMVRVLAAEQGRLPGLLRERPILDARGRPLRSGGVRLWAKTGTLNFTSALAGYLEWPNGRRLAFAIFAADPAARARVPPEARENPPGGDAWLARARAQTHALLRRWTFLYAA